LLFIAMSIMNKENKDSNNDENDDQGDFNDYDDDEQGRFDGDRRPTTDDRRLTTMGPTVDDNDDYYNAKTATVMTKMLHSEHILYWGTHKLQEFSSPLFFVIEVFHATVYWISS